MDSSFKAAQAMALKLGLRSPVTHQKNYYQSANDVLSPDDASATFFASLPKNQSSERSSKSVDRKQNPLKDTMTETKSFVIGKKVKSGIYRKDLGDSLQQKNVELKSPIQKLISGRSKVTNDIGVIGDLPAIELDPMKLKYSSCSRREAKDKEPDIEFGPKTYQQVMLSKSQIDELNNYESPKLDDYSLATPREKFFAKLVRHGSRVRKELRSERPKSPTYRYISHCKDLGILPEPIVAKALSTQNGCINLRSYGVGDNLVLAFSESLPFIENLTDINLNGNRITNKGIASLSRNAKIKKIQRLDISDNSIGLSGAMMLTPLIHSTGSSLVYLNMENNNMGDRAITAISQAVAQSKVIKTLNLSRCNIGHSGASALGKALASCKTLENLYLSWNQIRGLGAAELARGIEFCRSVRVLDLSWNAYGSLHGKQAVTALCEALRCNEVLTHLDISHNRLQEKDCAQLAEGLSMNRTLLGLHISGNEMEIDAYGFLLPDAQANDPCNGHIFTRMGEESKVNSGHTWDKRSNCWLCEKWDEVRFYWDPEESDSTLMNPQEVFLRAEFDYWKPKSMHLCDNGVWEIHRMVPPGCSQYYFTVNDEAKIALKQNFQSVEFKNVCGVVNYLPENVPLVNILNVKPRENLENSNCMPRESDYGDERKKDWFLRSVFTNFDGDTNQLLQSAFDYDWDMSRLKKISNDAKELENVREILFENYSMIKSIFIQYASTGAEPFSMGSNSYYDVLNDCNIFDEANYSKTDADMIFITASLSGPKSKANQKRSLLRFQFMEALAMTGFTKYYKSKIVKTPSEAIGLLLKDHIAQKISWHDAQKYRNGEVKRLYYEKVDAIFKQHLLGLKEMFQFVAGSMEPCSPGEPKRISLNEFMNLVVEADLTDETLTTREVKLAFLYSKETAVRELESLEKSRRINFNEFIEACSRIADMKDLTHFFIKLQSGCQESPETMEIANNIGIWPSSMSDWVSNTGTLEIKLAIVLKIFLIQAVKHRVGLIPPSLLEQVQELFKRIPYN